MFHLQVRRMKLGEKIITEGPRTSRVEAMATATPGVSHARGVAIATLFCECFPSCHPLSAPCTIRPCPYVLHSWWSNQRALRR